ncbi:MAG: PhoH family protein [Alkalibacterium gilvum]|uniref:PhoH family protein n=1 Tax=Alkalibacterium TaxID=99906 RepID=UPI0026475BE1|nr:PhoH family protein [Alkalibacterium sp.]MDN6194026.1 PhoH family protein [Alkalibacterium sp.]MDN6294108.1 PhoH family protein [Alkalibacterium sp.]MDN6295706.1 PhoH family protein [Alkalibacterium sp.]MDN6386014.1 PhoH family protein [Alkalibacterium sp.]MDN6397880.1 PhoH family protein [Alkalibacterium sp.]
MTESKEKRQIHLEDSQRVFALFGPQNSYLTIIEDEMNVIINSRGALLEVEGDKETIDVIEALFQQLLVLEEKGITIKKADIVSATRMAKQGTLGKFVKMYEEEITRDKDGKILRARNVGQRNYIDAIKKDDIVFGIGPAGTGKTFVAVAMAVSAMRKGEVKRIILTRPAVEAGENLGFLPGDLKEKVDPYLRPLYDALYTVLGTEHTNRLIERETIEIAPLAYMRGRTLDDAFIILDEAQNTTTQQMKMFLTRLGFGSKMVINGDITQIDLPKRVSSGLIHADRVLKEVHGISRVQFEAEDVVRHPLVAKVINAYVNETDRKD